MPFFFYRKRVFTVLLFSFFYLVLVVFLLLRFYDLYLVARYPISSLVLNGPSS